MRYKKIAQDQMKLESHPATWKFEKKIKSFLFCAYKEKYDNFLQFIMYIRPSYFEQKFFNQQHKSFEKESKIADQNF